MTNDGEEEMIREWRGGDDKRMESIEMGEGMREVFVGRRVNSVIIHLSLSFSVASLSLIWWFFTTGGRSSYWERRHICPIRA
jgi:hypothetical protein